jgi:hypothetical protein
VLTYTMLVSTSSTDDGTCCSQLRVPRSIARAHDHRRVSRRDAEAHRGRPLRGHLIDALRHRAAAATARASSTTDVSPTTTDPTGAPNPLERHTLKRGEDASIILRDSS